MIIYLRYILIYLFVFACLASEYSNSEQAKLEADSQNEITKPSKTDTNKINNSKDSIALIHSLAK